MHRRTLIQLSAAALTTLRASYAQQSFPGPHSETLRALARGVLPASLGDAALDRLAGQFSEWVRGYKSEAEMEHGYGVPRLRNKPASPAATYMSQLADLENANFGKLSATARHAAIETAINTAKIDALPASPTGRHVIADMMSWYFHGADAADLCYGVAIRREDCRGFAGGSAPPPPLKPGKGA